MNAIANPCNDNETDIDPSDDFYTVEINVDIELQGPSASFMITDGISIWGPFNYDDGSVVVGDFPADGSNIILTAFDVDYPSCQTSIELSQDPCSYSCFLEPSFTVGPCEDNGTSNDPLDDIFSVEINVVLTNGGISTQFFVTDGINTWGPFNYDDVAVIDSLPSNGIDIQLSIFDSLDTDCVASIVISSTPCSYDCSLDIEWSVYDCNDNGTGNSVEDDYFGFELIINADNPGIDQQFNLSFNGDTYGPYNYTDLIVFDSISIFESPFWLYAQDLQNAGCVDSIWIEQTPCSFDCGVQISDLNIGLCDNNGTLIDLEDDLFNLSFNTSGVNNSDSVIVFINNIIYDTLLFGETVFITDLQANNSNYEIIIQDVNDISCQDTINVSQAPCSECEISLDFNPVDTLDCLNTSVTLSANILTLGGLEYILLWTGPDPSLPDSIENPQVTVPGTYYLEASVSEDCSVFDSIVVDQNDLPEIEILGSYEITCYVECVEISSSASIDGAMYNWTGPGINSNNQNSASPLVCEPGTYSVYISDSTGCEGVAVEIEVLDHAIPPVAVLNFIGNLDCYAVNTTIEANGSSDGIYIWENDQGDTIGHSLILEVDEGGDYIFTVIDTLTGCSATDSVTILDLIEYPGSNVIPGDTLNCGITSTMISAFADFEISTLTYNWTTDDGSIVGNPNTDSIWVNAGGFYFVEIQDSINGCSSYDTVFVNEFYDYPVAEAGIDIQMNCMDEIYSLTGINSIYGGADIIWTGPGIISDPEGIEIEVNEPGTYYLWIQDQLSLCEAIDSVSLIPPDLPEIQYQAFNPDCAQESSGGLLIEAINGGTGPWDLTLNGVPISLDDDLLDLSEGNYVLTVLDAMGCETTDSFNLIDPGYLEVEAGEDQFIDLGDSTWINGVIDLFDTDVYSINWSPPYPLNCPECLSSSAFPLETTTFTIEVIDSNGCIVIDALTIFVDSEKDIYVPNIFSPNGDGINDLFQIYGKNMTRVHEFYIYNRWGEQVFEEKDFDPYDPYVGWNGTFKGKPVNPAVFAWYASVSFIDGSTIKIKGDVTVIR